MTIEGAWCSQKITFGSVVATSERDLSVSRGHGLGCLKKVLMLPSANTEKNWQSAGHASCLRIFGLSESGSAMPCQKPTTSSLVAGRDVCSCATARTCTKPRVTSPRAESKKGNVGRKQILPGVA